jgi:hypothetical protein
VGARCYIDGEPVVGDVASGLDSLTLQGFWAVISSLVSAVTTTRR